MVFVFTRIVVLRCIHERTIEDEAALSSVSKMPDHNCQAGIRIVPDSTRSGPYSTSDGESLAIGRSAVCNISKLNTISAIQIAATECGMLQPRSRYDIDGLMSPLAESPKSLQYLHHHELCHPFGPSRSSANQ